LCGRGLDVPGSRRVARLREPGRRGIAGRRRVRPAARRVGRRQVSVPRCKRWPASVAPVRLCFPWGCVALRRRAGPRGTSRGRGLTPGAWRGRATVGGRGRCATPRGERRLRTRAARRWTDRLPRRGFATAGRLRFPWGPVATRWRAGPGSDIALRSDVAPWSCVAAGRHGFTTGTWGSLASVIVTRSERRAPRFVLVGVVDRGTAHWQKPGWMASDEPQKVRMGAYCSARAWLGAAATEPYRSLIARPPSVLVHPGIIAAGRRSVGEPLTQPPGRRCQHDDGQRHDDQHQYRASVQRRHHANRLS
jgi:hypothetical protein